MERKYLELIGIAASIGSECPDWLDWHLNAAREAGATDAELREAIRMAQRVRTVILDGHNRFTTKL